MNRRRPRIGAEVDCVQCDRRMMPEGYELHHRTPVFVEFWRPGLVASDTSSSPMNPSVGHFVKPSFLERLFNSIVTGLVRAGAGPSHMRVLEVRGRKSGRLYSLPVDPLERDGGLFLVAPRGRTEWVRNAEAQGEVTLRRGGTSLRYRVRSLPDAERPPILKAYLERFRREVQRFFPVRAGSPVEAFVPLAERYPVFELTPER
jgi:deazaflavin-dependent oxidoreductase (nitroreductase family)